LPRGCWAKRWRCRSSTGPTCCSSIARWRCNAGRADSPIASHTISTAQKHGWIWDIGLPTRRGIGYVYSSRHAGADRAEEELAAYVGPGFASLTPREIPIRSGHRALLEK
jgi:hypothetical protein